MANEEDTTTKAIHNSIFEAYKDEWQRTRDIESKATGVVGFTGIVFSLIVTSLVTIISSTNEVTKKYIFSFYSQIFIFFILILMILSISCGILILTVKNWQFLCVYPFFEYCNMKKRKSEEIYEIATEQYIRIIEINENQNTKMVHLLRLSYYLFLGSIITLLAYIMHILNYVK